MEKINCLKLANDIKTQVAKKVYNYCQDIEAGHELYRRPGLAILLVGNNNESELYTKIKERESQSVGIDTNIYRFDEASSNEQITEAIGFLNQDDTIDGILVQLPLPKNLDTNAIVNTVKPSKDIDGFHRDNLESLLKQEGEHKIIPPVFGAVITITESLGLRLLGKQVVIIGKSDIFTNNLDHWLSSFGAKVNMYKATDNWQEASTEADIVITAVGQPKLIQARQLRTESILIDIGISKQEQLILGDFDASTARSQTGFYTPVPGGVGPLTVALALKNTLQAFELTHHG